MAISDKLNYLIETKDLFKDRLNSLGAGIIESTTFRNYLTWLDTFYNQSSDKTDLSLNGVVGRTSQDGDPTPENPVEINNLSGDVEYKVRGKNLLDKYNNLFQGTFLTAEGGNDSIASSTMFRCCTKKIDISNLSGDITCSGGYFELFAFYDENNNLISYVQNSTTTIPNGTKNVRVRFFGDSTEIPLSTLQELDLMVENNSTATSYEPYISESFTLSLGDIELCNISDYKDRIYSQNGEFYLEKKTGKVVFDGSESWAINTSYTYNVFYRTLDNYARISNAQTTYCEYYKGIENAGGIANFGNNYNNSIGVRTANDNIKDIYISNNSITSASDFKSWLTTHNTIVYYVLATLTTTEITEENYPTLYSQLLAIQEFLTKYKINKEFLLDYSSPEIEY